MNDPLNIVGAPVHPIDHEMQPVAHLIGGEPLADDPADDGFPDRAAVHGVLAGTTLRRKNNVQTNTCGARRRANEVRFILPSTVALVSVRFLHIFWVMQYRCMSDLHGLEDLR